MSKENNNGIEINLGKWLFFGFFMIILLIAAFSCYFTVGAGQRGVLVTWGSASDMAYSPGIHFKVPFVQDAILMDVTTQKYESDASAASQDLQTVSGKLATNYHLAPDSVPTIYKTLGMDYAVKVIQPLEQEIVKSVTAKYTAEQLITKREEVRQDIKTVLTEKLAPRGIIVEEVSIVNFDFSTSFNQAIEQKVTAEQNALKEQNQLKVVEYQAQQRIAQANGEAEAIKIQAQSVSAQGGADYVKLQAIQKWNGQMPNFVGGSSMPFISIPSSEPSVAPSK